MAYISQEKKKELAQGIKAALLKHGIKGSIAVRNHTVLVVNIRSGKIDFAADRSPNSDGTPLCVWTGGELINPYWYRDMHTGATLAFLIDLFNAMHQGNHDRSDAMSDHFDVGWYVNVNVGAWDKPYKMEG
jgi:hypothetical protein